MDNKKVAKELLKVAKELIAKNFLKDKNQMKRKLDALFSRDDNPIGNVSYGKSFSSSSPRIDIFASKDTRFNGFEKKDLVVITKFLKKYGVETDWSGSRGYTPGISYYTSDLED